MVALEDLVVGITANLQPPIHKSFVQRRVDAYKHASGIVKRSFGAVQRGIAAVYAIEDSG